jgi:hypothetical protein
LTESAEVVWTCTCGIKVKVVLHMTKTSVTVQCPDTSCKATRTLPGQITGVSIQNAPDVPWRSVDVNWLVYPPQESGKVHYANRVLKLTQDHKGISKGDGVLSFVQKVPLPAGALRDSK